MSSKVAKGLELMALQEALLWHGASVTTSLLSVESDVVNRTSSRRRTHVDALMLDVVPFSDLWMALSGPRQRRVMAMHIHSKRSESCAVA